MARLPRLSVPGYPHLLVQRSVAGQPAFLAETDYQFMLSELRSLSRRHEVAIHAYALMPDQFHLLVTPSDARSLSLAMQALGRRYVRDFNRRHGRSGTLWQARFRCTVVDPERFLVPCSLFVELGPERAQRVTDAKMYPWSSLSHHLGLQADTAISEHPEVWKLGNTPFERQRAYTELCEQPLDEREANRLLQATLKGWVLGSDSYREWAGRAANRRVSPLPRGRPRKIRETPQTR